MKTKFISIKSLFKDYLVQGKLISLNNSIELLALFRRIGFRITGLLFLGVKRRQSRSVQLIHFGKHILKMVKHHGDVYTVNYLKACQLAVQKAVARDKVSSLRDLNPMLALPRLASCGLPGIIPKEDRRSILGGAPAVIR